MKLYRSELRNGIFYNHIETDRFKTGFLSLNFIMPLERNEVAANALLSNVLRRGCRAYPDQAAIGRRLEELYGADIVTRISKRGESQIISFSADMLDDAYRLPQDNTDIFGGVADLLAKLLFDPLVDENGLFNPEYVETERLGRIDTVRALVNNKRRYAINRLTALMCAEEKNGISVEGTVEDYESFDPCALKDAYRRFVSETHIEVFYVGTRRREDVEPILTDIFAKLTRAEGIKLPETEVIRVAQKRRDIEEQAPIVQGNLVVGFRTGTVITDVDYLAFPLFNEVYGGSPASKLFMNVREKKSLCYYCSSFGDTVKGVMLVSAGIENKNRDEAVAEILLQLEKMKQGEIDEGELLCAKQALFNSYRTIADNPAGLEAWYLGRVLAGRIESPEEVTEKLQAVGIADIAALARKVTLDTVYFLRGTLKEENKGGDEDAE